MHEFNLIAMIRDRCALAREDVRLGIGDDAALLAVPAGQILAVSTDTLVAGVHFPQSTRPFDVGWKSLAVNLSDLAAMGATPAWATLALTLPDADAQWVGQFADGFAALAGEFKLALVGGDMTQGSLSITVCVHGFVPDGAALLRSAARVGDGVYVTGTLGDAAAGLRCIEQDKGGSATPPLASATACASLIERLDRPTPRVAQGLALRGRANACIDISDGLVADLGHICAASGVGAEIDVETLPASSALFGALDASTRHALQLTGGDDYELCFTAADSEAPSLLGDLARSGCGATRIGRIVAGRGVATRDASGNPLVVMQPGWEHFS
ncbi:MAG TPA: thiamine-phosphate kinase [Rhodanobacteraceae bacterium]|nr:thiamine-phosphate kinase [Rhodanobacteraceae bacterium]